MGWHCVDAGQSVRVTIVGDKDHLQLDTVTIDSQVKFLVAAGPDQLRFGQGDVWSGRRYERPTIVTLRGA